MPNLLQNVRFNFLTFLVGKSAAFVVNIVLLPRLLGPERMGQYTAAWGMVLLVSSISDLGLATYLTGEVSRARDRTGELFYRAFLAQIFQLAAAALALWVIVMCSKGSSVGPALVALAFLGPGFASLGSPFLATLQGLEEFKTTAIVMSLASMMNAGALGIALWLRPEPAIAFAALGVSGVLGFALWIMVFARMGFFGEFPKLWRLWNFFKESFPFAMVSAVSVLYLRVDITILAWMLGADAIGQYGVAVKFVEPMVPLLGALSGPLYPRLSAEFKSASIHRALRYLGALCLPMGVGGSVLATPIMAWMFGSPYHAAGSSFQWLVWVPALTGIHIALLHAMNALGKTKVMALIFSINLVLNVVLNVMLIPHYGIVASAAISALCEAIVLVAALGVLAKSGFALGLRRWLWPSMPSALGMGLFLALLPTPNGWQVPAWITLGALVYALLLWILGFMEDEERLHLGRLLSRG